MKLMTIRLYHRSGFRPCCQLRAEYRPCNCPSWGVELLDANGNVLEPVEVPPRGSLPV